MGVLKLGISVGDLNVAFWGLGRRNSVLSRAEVQYGLGVILSEWLQMAMSGCKVIIRANKILQVWCVRLRCI